MSSRDHDQLLSKMMRRIVLVVLALALLLVTACGRSTTSGSISPIATATPVTLDLADANPPTELLPAALLADPDTQSTDPVPDPELSPETATGPTTATDLSLNPANVVLYPVPVIYAGDKVTFQLLPTVPQQINVADVNAIILVDGVPVASGPLDRRNWTGQAEGVYEWAWDTTGLSGDYQIEVVLDPTDAIQTGDEDPLNNSVTITATVNIPSGQAARDLNATWKTMEIDCCVIHVVSGTAAERDLTILAPLLESAVRQAAGRLSVTPSQKLHVYFIDRTVGQGGFAGTDVVVSYVDRNYAGGDIYELLVHEATHILDQQFAPRRISFLAEGLALWVSGGHYKPEDLTKRAAALLSSGRYTPLASVINDFYPVQHEIGYLEAGGFVAWLIERGGWNTFKEFYSDVSANDGPTLADAVSVNLQRYYGASLTQIEDEWLAALRRIPGDPAAVADLQSTIRYYDIARRYQEIYDPTAHYLSAWMPHPTQVREFGNPADLTRRPTQEINVTLELMLIAANMAIRHADYDRANVILDSVSNILNNGGNIIDPMATNYLKIVRAAAEYGYELHRVDLAGDKALAIATQAPRIQLTNLVMELRGQNWVILSH